MNPKLLKNFFQPTEDCVFATPDFGWSITLTEREDSFWYSVLQTGHSVLTMISHKVQLHYDQSGSMLELVHCGRGTTLGDFDRCVYYRWVQLSSLWSMCIYCTSVVVTQAATVTDAWDPSASRCLTCLRALLSAAGLVYVITLAAVHRAKRLAAREMATFA